jgi:hypothetical protein
VLANEDIDAVGLKNRVLSLMSDVEMIFDERFPSHYDLFNIRYLILPGDRKPPTGATLLAQQGRHKLWQMDTGGYLQVVDTVAPPIVEDKGSIATHAMPFLSSEQLVQHEFPTVAFNGAPAAEPTLPQGAVPQGPPGRVEFQESSPADGIFKGEIVANRPAVVLLKVSYDPRWRVSVDGVDQPIQMIAPALMGRTVPAGPHTIVFHYVSDPEYPLLFGIGLLALVGLWLAQRHLDRNPWERLRTTWPRRPRLLVK